MIKVAKIRCVGGNKNMPFTVGKDYYNFKLFTDSKKICIEDDNGEWHTSNGNYKSGNLKVEIARGLGSSFKLISLPYETEDVSDEQENK